MLKPHSLQLFQDVGEKIMINIIEKYKSSSVHKVTDCQHVTCLFEGTNISIFAFTFTLRLLFPLKKILTLPLFIQVHQFKYTVYTQVFI